MHPFGTTEQHTRLFDNSPTVRSNPHCTPFSIANVDVDCTGQSRNADKADFVGRSNSAFAFSRLIASFTA
jgi:hypothetical protein